MINNLEAIENLLRLNKGSLKEAFEKEEGIDIEIPKLVIRTEKENQRYEENIEATKKQRYDSGVEKGEKEAVLKFAGENGITIGDDKAKKIINLIPIYKEKILAEAKVEPDKRIRTLESESETLRNNYKALEGQFNDYKSGIEKERESRLMDGDILKAIPRKDVSYMIEDEDLLALVKRKQQFGRIDGKTVAINENGEPIKSGQTLDPVPLTDVMTDLVKPYTKQVSGGAGGGDGTGGATKSGYDSFVEEMKEKGHNVGSEAFQREMNKRIADKTLTL